MATATLTPNAAARTISATLKRPVTPKGVRTMARSIIARFDKTKHPEYQAHAYTATEMRTLTEAFKARGSRSVAQPARKPRASKATSVRKPRAPKAPVSE